MRPRTKFRPVVGVAALAAVLVILLLAFSFGQTERAEQPAEAATAGISPASDSAAAAPEQGDVKPPAAAQTTPAPAASLTPGVPGIVTDDMVALNLNKVSIDQVITFLSEITGKVVTKHKAAQTELTIVSPRKVTREEALRLIVEALRLDDIAVIERDTTMWLIPTSKLPEIDIGLLQETGKEPVVGVVQKVIQVRFADMTQLEKVIKPLLSKDAKLVVDPGSRKLVIVDTVDRIANLQRLVEQLDVLEMDDRQVRVFVLKYANAEELAPILQAVLAEPRASQPQQGGTPGQQQQQQQQQQQGGQAAASTKRVAVEPYKTVNWLVVAAPRELLMRAEQLVEQLDQEYPQELKIRIIQINYAEATALAQQLQTLFRKRPEKRLQDTVEISADERSNSLLVLSSQQNYELVKKVVDQLDSEESVQVATKMYSLEHADADDIAQQLNDLYSGMQQQNPWDWYGYWGYSSSRQQQKNVRFVAERRTNSVIAIAPPAEFDKINALIEKLDVALDVEQVAPRIFRLRYNDAKALTDVLKETFGSEDITQTGGYYYYRYLENAQTEVGRLYGKVTFVPETTTNSIIVITNNEENYPVIKAVIEELDRATTDAANTMVVQLTNAKATEVAEQLNTLFAIPGAKAPQQQGEQQAPADFYWFYGRQQQTEERPISNLIGQVRVVPAERINAVVVTTATQNFETIKSLVKELDIESPKVFVSVKLIEVARTRSRRIGTRFSSSGSVFDSEDFDNGLKSQLGLEWEEIHKDGAIRADMDINLLVQFLSRNYDARILSEPKQAMNNNYTATLFIGDQVPFIKSSVVTGEGSRTDSFEYKDAGTKLIITPHINQLDRVVMNVTFESTQVKVGEVILGGATLQTRKFDTELAVDSGQTMVMGGIMREQVVEDVRRVPILGYIPVVNLAFKKRDSKHESTELIAFITPTVLHTPADDLETTLKAQEDLSGMGDRNARTTAKGEKEPVEATKQ